MAHHALLDLHHDEFAIRTAALAWLSDVCKLPESGHLIETVVLPCAWTSIKAKNHDIRRGFLLLLRDVVS